MWLKFTVIAYAFGGFFIAFMAGNGLAHQNPSTLWWLGLAFFTQCSLFSYAWKGVKHD